MIVHQNFQSSKFHKRTLDYSLTHRTFTIKFHVERNVCLKQKYRIQKQILHLLNHTRATKNYSPKLQEILTQIYSMCKVLLSFIPICEGKRLSENPGVTNLRNITCFPQHNRARITSIKSEQYEQAQLSFSFVHVTVLYHFKKEIKINDC